MAADFTPSDQRSSSSLDVDSLRALVRLKLRDGTLPWDSIPRVWGGKGANEICSACGEKVRPEGLVMEGIGEKMAAVQFHVGCFHMWDVERRMPATD
jgi:hypothetical protein